VVPIDWFFVAAFSIFAAESLYGFHERRMEKHDERVRRDALIDEWLYEEE